MLAGLAHASDPAADIVIASDFAFLGRVQSLVMDGKATAEQHWFVRRSGSHITRIVVVHFERWNDGVEGSFGYPTLRMQRLGAYDYLHQSFPMESRCAIATDEVRAMIRKAGLRLARECIATRFVRSNVSVPNLGTVVLGGLITGGIGYLMQTAGSQQRMPLAFAGLVTIGAMAMAMYELFSWVEDPEAKNCKVIIDVDDGFEWTIEPFETGVAHFEGLPALPEGVAESVGLRERSVYVRFGATAPTAAQFDPTDVSQRTVPWLIHEGFVIGQVSDFEPDANPLLLVDTPDPSARYDAAISYGTGTEPVLATGMITTLSQ